MNRCCSYQDWLLRRGSGKGCLCACCPSSINRLTKGFYGFIPPTIPLHESGIDGRFRKDKWYVPHCIAHRRTVLSPFPRAHEFKNKLKKADTCINRPTLPMQYTERRFLAAIATAMYATQYGQNEMISLIKQDLNVQATYVKKIFSSIEFL